METLDAVTARPIGPWANGMLMTPEEFDATTEWDPDYRYELVHGVLIVSPPADIGERDPNGELDFLLRTYQYSHPRGSGVDKTVSEETVATSAGRRRMDRAIWCGLGRHPQEGDVPAIAVEFVSDSSRDRRRDYESKRHEYLEIGVREYWVIDRFLRRMTVYRGDDVAVVAEQDVYRTELLPGFELPLGRLLKLADDWLAGASGGPTPAT
ncbi:Uma2 family endonuclease [Planctellipticum variicoloris]|uniref:Uma2 family endonuclease n=1 Tax=Planctellipticum variicoloris TaxID=3064265 RepID=UPI003013D8A5|nr:Uma2 family endonuclease [Planctomycetaceae bacterium SH412]